MCVAPLREPEKGQRWCPVFQGTWTSSGEIEWQVSKPKNRRNDKNREREVLC